MDIVFVIESAGNGGTEMYVEGLSKYLLHHDISVEIVTISGSQSEAQARFPDLTVSALPALAHLGAFLASRPNAIVNLHLYTSLLPAAKLVKTTGATLLLTLHQPLTAWNLWHRMRWMRAACTADGVIAVSEACFDGFGPFLDRSKAAIVSGPLPLNSLPARIRPKPQLAHPRLLFVGRLSKEKDLPTLLHAAAAVDGAKIDIIGDGNQRKFCEDLAKDLGLNVCFHGALPREAVFEIMQQVDIFIMPSRFEGFGIAAIEAMALGIPTIVADFPAAREYLIPGKTGLSFPIGNSDQLSGCIKQVVADNELRQNLSKEGALHVRNFFAAETQFGRYVDLAKKWL